MIDIEEHFVLSPAQVRAVCDRHKGIGADGVIRVSAPSQGAEVGMELYNADGSRAETSGNGLRCLAQAVVDAGLLPTMGIVPIERPGHMEVAFTVSTVAGIHRVVYSEKRLPSGIREMATARVTMASVLIGAEEPSLSPVGRARSVFIGNPHLVVLHPDLQELDVTALGSDISSSKPEGTNVEFISVAMDEDRLFMRVFERGVGETMACGTGSCAAALAARSWGLCGSTVSVMSPGGELIVDMSGDEVILEGPVQRIGKVEINMPELLAGNG
jgi:diaminopimelate epimerase